MKPFSTMKTYFAATKDEMMKLKLTCVFMGVDVKDDSKFYMVVSMPDYEHYKAVQTSPYILTARGMFFAPGAKRTMMSPMTPVLGLPHALIIEP